MNQKYKNFEVIIVDDCSTDGSWEKLQNYVKEVPLSITLLQAERNSGPGKARNIGLDNVQGEWVTFIDSDDWVDNLFFEKINNVIEKEHVNCVIYDYNTWLDGKTGVARSMYINKPGLKIMFYVISLIKDITMI